MVTILCCLERFRIEVVLKEGCWVPRRVYLLLALAYLVRYLMNLDLAGSDRSRLCLYLVLEHFLSLDGAEL